MGAAKDSGMKDTAAPALIAQERGLNKQAAAGVVRRTQLASLEFTADVVDAVASGWKSFRNEINQSNAILDSSVLRGSVEAAATFLEGVAKAARMSYERFEAAAPAVAAAPAEIDYDKLATLVAAKLQALKQ